MAIRSGGATPKVNADGSIDTRAQEQTTPIVDHKFYRELNAATIGTNTTREDSVIAFEAGHSFVANDWICLKEAGRFYQGKVLSVATDDVTVSPSLDYAYTTAATAARVTVEMAVDGTLGSPLVYGISPPTTLYQGGVVTWHITRIMLSMIHIAAADDGKFGGIAAIVNGLLLRQKNGEYFNIFNARTNGDFALRAYDVVYTAKAPAGANGTRIRRSFSGDDKNGVVIQLDGSTSDELQLHVQDALSTNTSIEAVAQGHYTLE